MKGDNFKLSNKRTIKIDGENIKIPGFLIHKIIRLDVGIISLGGPHERIY